MIWLHDFHQIIYMVLIIGVKNIPILNINFISFFIPNIFVFFVYFIGGSSCIYL